jgi:hypothetical protein
MIDRDALMRQLGYEFRMTGVREILLVKLGEKALSFQTLDALDDFLQAKAEEVGRKK